MTRAPSIVWLTVSWALRPPVEAARGAGGLAGAGAGVWAESDQAHASAAAANKRRDMDFFFMGFRLWIGTVDTTRRGYRLYQSPARAEQDNIAARRSASASKNAVLSEDVPGVVP